MSDRPTPFTLADEKRTLLDFLDYLRESIQLKVVDLEEQGARWSPVPTGTSLLGLAKHLTRVEVAWFSFGFAGHDVELPPNSVGSDDTVASVVRGYREACDASNRIIESASGLEVLAARPLIAPEAMSLRWILVHMVEETARHAGHADILREQLDGSVGR